MVAEYFIIRFHLFTLLNAVNGKITLILLLIKIVPTSIHLKLQRHIHERQILAKLGDTSRSLAIHREMLPNLATKINRHK